MDKLISIIVPVYNVKEYVRNCLDSIIAQTYQNIEILVIDDGSTDGSGQICDEVAKKDTRIKVVHTTNHGLSVARNTGLDMARGEYIGLVDSDDCISPWMYETLLKCAEKEKVDIVVADFQRISNENKYVWEQVTKRNEEIISGEDALCRLCYSQGKHDMVKFVLVTNKLYAKSLFDEVRFREGIVHEDEDVMYQLLGNASKVGVLDISLYGYLKRPGSITDAGVTKHYANKVTVLIERNAFLKNKFPRAYCYSLLHCLKTLQSFYLILKYEKKADNKVLSYIWHTYKEVYEEAQKEHNMIMEFSFKVRHLLFLHCTYIYLVCWKGIKLFRNRRVNY